MTRSPATELAALRTAVADMRKDLAQLPLLIVEVRKLAARVDALGRPGPGSNHPAMQGVTRLPDGELFVPGTGPTGTSQLSDAARAAEAALEANDVDPDVPAEGPAAERLARVTRLAEHARTTNTDNESR